MGCTASRTTTIVANTTSEDPSPPPSSSLSLSLASSSSSSSSSTSSSSASNCFNSSPKVPKAMSLQMPLVHHPPTKKGDTHHLVFLTSTTYGSLLLIDQKDSNFMKDSPPSHAADESQKTEEQEQSSLSPDSVINTWELMHDLDEEAKEQEQDLTHLHITTSSIVGDGVSHKTSSSCRYTAFDGSARKKLLDSFESLKEASSSSEKLNMESENLSSKKPLWQHLSEEALLAKLDPSVAWSYRRALSSRQLGSNTNINIIITNNNNLYNNGVRSMGSSPLYSSCSSSSTTTSFANNNSNSVCHLPGTEDRIVVYCTSLRGIRKTFEDCCSVRMILRGFRVAVDERDISMDSSYRKELQDALGVKAVTLPQVFIRGNHVGNAEDLKKLNENGDLARLLRGFPVHDPGFVCENCGDARFVPCPNCSGSRKVFEEKEGGLRRCPDCNENGLIRCSRCCS
ncbi:uncharacterized protein At3g28850-like [Arachis stenosperma]|uniref:uncharacterized protein At3g28850-like n=1 Tax=Arachis stenosperma TaxID=217475 RepID=UPI0025ACE9B6|nr:uncharacterized protein At3g28850-like [Arachis stenosperma]